jgi:hypothetical protein
MEGRQGGRGGGEEEEEERGKGKGREGRTGIGPGSLTARETLLEEGSELLGEGEDAVDVQAENAAAGESRIKSIASRGRGGEDAPAPGGVGVLVVAMRKIQGVSKLPTARLKRKGDKER